MWGWEGTGRAITGGQHDVVTHCSALECGHPTGVLMFSKPHL